MGVSHGVKVVVHSILVGVILSFSLLAVAEETSDPFESLNRRTQGLNDYADEHFMRPVARGYGKVLPEPVRFSIGRVYGNLRDVGDAVNNLLQGKPVAFLGDLARVMVNSTVGLGGLFDPASQIGLRNHDEDFSQTLATWGVPRGPYVVIPFLGPSGLRDVFGRAVNNRQDPLIYLHPVDHRNTTGGMRLVHTRNGLLLVDSVVFGDRYIFFRDAYIQRRQYLENDGEIEEDPFSDDF